MIRTIMRPGASLLCAAFSVVLFSCGANRIDVDDINSLDDLKGKKIAVPVGSTVDVLLTEKYPEVEKYYTTDISSSYLMVMIGRAAATLTTYPGVLSFLRNHPEMTYKEMAFKNKPISTGFGSPELREAYNGYLAEARASGEYDKICQKWIEHTDTAEMPEFVFPDDGKVLNVGITIIPPFDFLTDDKPCGLELELLYGFCEKNGFRPECRILPFSGLITALSTGKIDVICSSMAYSEERAKAVLFSDPVYHVRTVAVLKNPAYKDPGSFWERLKAQVRINLVEENRYRCMVDGLKGTLLIYFMSLLLGTVFGGMVCWLRMSGRKLLRSFATAYVEIMRCIPQLVLLMILFYVVFANSGLSGLWVAAITFALYFASFASEMFRKSFGEVDRGQVEAGLSLGFRKKQVFMQIVLPQALRTLIPVFKGEAMTLIKMTAIVGYVAVEDLTYASDLIRGHTYEAFFPLILVALAYLLLTWVVSGLLSLLERAVSKPALK